MEIIYKSLNKEAKLRALFDSVGILPSLLQTPDAHTAHRGRAGFGLVLKAKGDDLKPLLHAAHRAAMFTAGSQLLTPSSSCSFPSASHEALTAAAPGFSLRAAPRPLGRAQKTRKLEVANSPCRNPHRRPPLPCGTPAGSRQLKGEIKNKFPQSAAGPALPGASASCSGTAAGHGPPEGRGAGWGQAGGRPPGHRHGDPTRIDHHRSPPRPPPLPRQEAEGRPAAGPGR